MTVDSRRVALAALLVVGLVGCGGGSKATPAPAAPTIALSSANLAFSATAGGANPAAQTVTVTNTGGGALATPVASVAYTTGSGWLNVTVSGAAAPYTISAQPAVGSLTAGVYTATVSVASAGATNTPRTIAVSFTVAAAPQPTLSLSAATASFTGKPSGPAPAAQTVTATNTGAGTLARPTTSIAYGSGAGWLTATVSGAATPYTISIQAQPSGLSVGSYTATVNVASAGATNSPVAISVSLTVDQTWTVFVYGHADHNLSASLIRDIAEMVNATLTSNVNVIVAVDLSAGRKHADGTNYPTGTGWLRIPGGGADPIDLGTLAEQNFDDPAILQASIEAAFTSYPADRYGLILWDHGGSWQGGFGGDENDQPGNSAVYGGGMSVQQVATAVRAALDSSGLPGTRPLEFLSFDTCLMAGNEVAYEMRGLSKVYIANAELDFGDGWDYAATFTYLNSHRGATPQAFAQAEVGFWNLHHVAAGNDDKQLRSHIAIDLGQYDAYTSAFADLTAALLTSTTIDPFEVARVQYSAIPVYGADFANPSAFSDLRDAGQILAGLGSVTSDGVVAARATSAQTALSAMTLGSSNGDLRVANGQAGFHMESPLATEWAARKGGYVSLPWNAATDWATLLDGMATFADAAAPAIVTSIGNATNPTTANPPTLTLSSVDADVAEARVFLAETIGGVTVMYGVVGTGTVLPNTAYQFVWDGAQVVLGDGVSLSFITALPWVGGASPVFIAPGTLTADGETIQAYAVLDSSSTAVTTIFIQVDGRLAALKTSALRGTVFTPMVWDVTSGNFIADTALTIPNVVNASLTLSRTQSTAGNYHLVTSMTDVWGNSGSVADNVTVVNPF